MTTRAAIIPLAAGLWALPLLGGCAATGQPEDTDAYRDFIEVAELPEVASMRTTGGVGQAVLDDKYVIVTNGDDNYLLVYATRCEKDGFTGGVKPDVRQDARRIYAGFDTFRGCRIEALYEITPDQVVELHRLGMAPGEKPRRSP